jgi:rhodanese-related sulfurtransferase
MSGPLYPLAVFGDEAGFVVIFLIGLAFGFFLERAGFGSARKLAGIFYFRDFAVLRVMFTAIVVPMLGLLYMSSLGWLEMEAVNVPPTFLGGQIVGGLLLGFGFVIGGYCPGTSVVAAASGKWDGLVFMLGLIFGTGVFGLGFDWIEGLYRWGSLGTVTLSEWSGISAGTLGFLIVLIALGAFAATEYADRKKAGAADAGGKFMSLQVSWQRGGAALAVVLGFALMTAHSIAGQGVDVSKLAASGDDLIEPAELAAAVAQNKPVTMIDLREPASFAQYHIPGASNLAFEQLAKAELPRDRMVVLCSVDGVRAGQAWAVLASRGIQTRILKGGLRQWWAEVATPPDLRLGGGAPVVLPVANGAASSGAPAAPAAAPPAVGGVKKFKKGSSCS